MTIRAEGAGTLVRRSWWRWSRRQAPVVEWRPVMEGVAHVFPESSRAEFVACGFRPSFFFPHRVHRLPKCGPDGARLASRMCGVTDLERLWQIVLYAERPALDEFPEEIFYDPDLVWHQQHFGRTGQIASVDLAVKRGILYSMAHQSDLVQRISRRRDLKTRVEKVPPRTLDEVAADLYLSAGT